MTRLLCECGETIAASNVARHRLRPRHRMLIAGKQAAKPRVRSDAAYDFFVEDAKAQGFTVLADYFRHFGIVPPANYGRPRFKDREVTAHDRLDAITQLRTWTGAYSIYKSWGEPGETMLKADTTDDDGGDSDA